MNKIWKVEIYYTTYDGSMWLTIGMFTNENDAEEAKSKWEDFHINSKKMLDEPENWIPENDDWYDDNYRYGFHWEDSNEYFKLTQKYNKIQEFQEIVITETKLNTDIFIESINYEFSGFTDPFKLLVKEFDRDYKIKNLLK
jgi:hypothetical protein